MVFGWFIWLTKCNNKTKQHPPALRGFTTLLVFGLSYWFYAQTALEPQARGAASLGAGEQPQRGLGTPGS